MSNYDWFDTWTPYDTDVVEAVGGDRHCANVGEHTPHRFSVTPYDPNYRRVRPGPYYRCPGTPARAERFKDMIIHFHDDKTVTWSKPVDMAAELQKINETRKLAGNVEPLQAP